MVVWVVEVQGVGFYEFDSKDMAEAYAGGVVVWSGRKYRVFKKFVAKESA